MHSSYAGVDYSFLYAKDLNEKDAIGSVVTNEDNLAKINIWVA